MNNGTWTIIWTTY